MPIVNLERLIGNTKSIQDRDSRATVLKALSAALRAADPREIVRSQISVEGERLVVLDRSFDLRRFKRIYVIGGGKAAGAMTEAVETLLGERITDGLVNIPQKDPVQYVLCRVKMIRASHPTPNEEGVRGVRGMLDLLKNVNAEDLVVCLISGGGSSLMPQPADGISLEVKGRVAGELMRRGANINELNTVRKHLSKFKGGGLAKAAYPATLVALILSDVVGDPLEIIASGPTSPDPSTFQDAMLVLQKYGMWETVDPAVGDRFSKGLKGEVSETPKSDDPCFRKVHNFILGSNRRACSAAVQSLRDKGVDAQLLTTHLEGEARNIGLVLASLVKEAVDTCVSRAFVLGGETTVTVRGKGFGGRNQEVALGSIWKISGVRGGVVASMGSDGVDGPTDAAGAVVDGGSLETAEEKCLDPRKFLDDNNSYEFFKQTGDLIFTGPTGTNVNDIAIALYLKQHT